MKGRLYVTELKRRKHRRKKIKKLREKYLKAETEEEKKQIIEKALRVNPYLTEGMFLEPIKSKLGKAGKREGLKEEQKKEEE
jgi:hypothetical protein